MKHAIAIAKAKVKRGSKQPLERIREPAVLEEEISKVGLGSLMVMGLIIGLGAGVCLLSGIIKSGGPLQFFGDLFSALL